ncbi:phosphocarrier protein [Anaerosolibacter carboniphilus]|uniref:Phosphocarrier protein HPr n=1 Tax=Anaerosolibacter carboniphilus TaxID=1417629 RepID=A0A841L532_9FIRM|nr:HPr family phosphocarrier protein [Anaerosolibacter carboniphilus]MBB6217425.1 phosphocarrier protein [Anaerosolibacter carboniphilus]
MYKKEVMVTNQTGLHARPASEFSRTAASFKSDIQIEYGEKRVNAKSIIGLLSAGISFGSKIVISAEGEDEQQAVEALKDLVKTNFGE